MTTEPTPAESNGAAAAAVSEGPIAAAAASTATYITTNTTAAAAAAASGGGNQKAKRTAERQITKDDDGDDGGDGNDRGDGGDPGTGHVKASDDVLRHRRIVKVARTVTGAVDFAKKKKNPFAAVQLTTGSSSSTAADGTTSIGAAAANGTASEQAVKVFGSTAAFSGFGAASGTGFGAASGTGFGAASGSGFATTVQPGFTFGTGTTTTSMKSIFGLTAANAFGTNGNDESAAAADDENNKNNDNDSSGTTPAVQLPDEYRTVSGEEDEVVLFATRCKTHRWGVKKVSDTESATSASEKHKVLSVPPSSDSATLGQVKPREPKDVTDSGGNDDQKKIEDDDKKKEDTDTAAATDSSWQEVGTGPLRVLRHSTSQAVRLVQRRETIPNGPSTKVLINLPVWRESVVTQPGDKHCKIATMDTVQGQTETVLFRCRLSEEASDLAACLRKQAAMAKSMTGQE
jgi:hypothetical protein